jgi:hypothetical protein
MHLLALVTLGGLFTFRKEAFMCGFRPRVLGRLRGCFLQVGWDEISEKGMAKRVVGLVDSHTALLILMVMGSGSSS